jgi:hypothetical protein
MDARVAEHVVPFYEDQAAIDSARLEILQHTIFGAPLPSVPSTWQNRVTYAQLRTAAMFDATAFRAFWRIMGMISRPEDVYMNPQVVERTHEPSVSMAAVCRSFNHLANSCSPLSGQR